MRKFLTVCLIAFPLIVVALVIAQFSSVQGFDEKALIDLGFIPVKPLRSIGTMPLKTTKGDTINLTQAGEQWTVIYTGYTRCPDICPITLGNFAAAKVRLDGIENLTDTFRFMMITIDPLRDTAKALRRYIDAFDPTITGLVPTVKQVEINNLQFGLPPIDKSVFKIDHSKLHHSSSANEPAPVIQLPSQNKNESDSENLDSVEIPHNDKIIVLHPNGKLIGYIGTKASADKLAIILATLARHFEGN